MNMIFLLIGFSILLALLFLLAFFWASKSGQNDDLYTPAVRILFDDHPNQEPDAPLQNQQTIAPQQHQQITSPLQHQQTNTNQLMTERCIRIQIRHKPQSTPPATIPQKK